MHDNYRNRQNNAEDRNVKVATPVEEPVIEESVVAVAEAPTAVDQGAPPVEMPKKDVIAVVVGCTRLNVREKPNKDAGVVTIIPVNSEVMVDLEGSTEKFYKICNAAGIEGFCMRQYIEIR